MKGYKFKTMDGIDDRKLFAVFSDLYEEKRMNRYSFNSDEYEWKIGGDVFIRLSHVFKTVNCPYDAIANKFMGIDIKVFAPGVKPNCIFLNRKNSRELKVALNDVYGTGMFNKEDKRMDGIDAMRYVADDMISLSKTYNNMFEKDTPKKVIFNDPATIVYWKDGTKTVVKAEDEPFDPEKGLAMAIAKKYLGNKGNYYDIFRKWLPKEEDFSKYMNPTISEQYELLTVKQFAEKTGQSEVTIRRDCRKKLHPGAKKVDGKWMIPFSGIVGGNENDK